MKVTFHTAEGPRTVHMSSEATQIEIEVGSAVFDELPLDTIECLAGAVTKQATLREGPLAKAMTKTLLGHLAQTASASN